MKPTPAFIAYFVLSSLLSAQEVADSFEAKVFQEGDFALNYRIHVRQNLKNTPIWTFHGDQDTSVKTQRSRDMSEAIKQSGGSLIQYTEYPEVSHNSWTRTYANDEVLDWLFAQKKL